MRELIDLFRVRYTQLRQAVLDSDDAVISATDPEVEVLMDRIFDRKAVTTSEVQMQFLLVVELLKAEADDESCVIRHTENLKRIIERHIAPGADSEVFTGLRELAPSRPANDSSGKVAATLDIAMLESLPDRVAVIAPDYRYLFTNSVNASALDRAPEEIVGKHVGEFVGIHRFIQGLKERLDRCFQGEISEYTYAEESGERTIVTRCKISPYYHGSTQLIGALVRMEEIADRRQSNAA